ncbi:glycosyltransferase family 2 protein [Flavobacteriales bacterium]|nr:glycosyltransferase family 2 protein [Flavobacteriales bacterium]
MGIKHSRGNYLLFLNNDTIVLKDTITKLVKSLERDPALGVVSPKIRYHYNPSVVQYAGSTPMDPLTLRNTHVGNRKIDDGRYDQEEDTSYAHGAAMMIPRHVIDQVGSMPENYFLYYEELDWCEQIKNAGYRIRYIPSSLVYHKESMSVGKDSVMKVYYITRNRILFARRNFGGWRFAVSMLYVLLVSIPKNTLTNIANMAKMKAYYGGMLWNLSNGRIAIKPF